MWAEKILSWIVLLWSRISVIIIANIFFPSHLSHYFLTHVPVMTAINGMSDVHRM